MIYFGDTKIGKLYLGSTPIGKAYLGGNLVYQSGPAGFAVTYNLTGVTSSNTARKVLGPYTTTLTTTDSTFTIWTVSVTMGGIDITSTAYANGVVTIADVTDEVAISAYAALLPQGYTRLKYIKNTNRTYINTGIYLSSSDHIICNFRDATTTAKNRFLFGTRNDTTKKQIWANNYHGYNGGGTVYPRFGTLAPNNYYSCGGTGTTNIGKVEIENKIWKFGGTTSTYNASSGGDFDCENTCTLFGRGSTESYDCSDLCIARFFVEGKMDAYAALNPSNEPVLFDIVSKTDLKSPDNIAFEAGPNY